MDLRHGMLVKHTTLGLGKIVAIDDAAVHVVFATLDARHATKLRLPAALQFLSPSGDVNAWLSGLTGFVLDGKTGRYGRVTTWLSHPEALERFVQEFPRGFADPAYLSPESRRSDRQVRWRRAGAEYAALLGDRQGEQLLEAGEVRKLVERASKIERIVRGIQREDEKESFEVRLENPERAAAYFGALFAFIGAARPHRGKFEALAAAVRALDTAAPAESGWQLITMLPFVARPEMHMVLRPRFICDVAQRLGLDLAYDAEPNWSTYGSLLAATSGLLEKLKPLGARDHVDVEAFMHVTMAKAARPKAKRAPGKPAAAGASRKATATAG